MVLTPGVWKAMPAKFMKSRNGYPDRNCYRGGNIFRGLSGTNKGFDRVKGDSMGMLATVINSLALSSALDNEGCKNKVLTAIRMEPIGEFYSKLKPWNI